MAFGCATPALAEAARSARSAQSFDRGVGPGGEHRSRKPARSCLLNAEAPGWGGDSTGARLTVGPVPEQQKAGELFGLHRSKPTTDATRLPICRHRARCCIAL